MDFNGILFYNNVSTVDDAVRSGCVVHILCNAGSCSFNISHIRYNVSATDYVILPCGTLAAGFSSSDDFSGITMTLDNNFVNSRTIRSNYGIIGHLALLQNPVLRLSSRDYKICFDALSTIKSRLSETGHFFLEEMVGSLLSAHILDLYDIHARAQSETDVSERQATLLRQFIELLFDGAYREHRNLSWYAGQLCITPHYLSELCKRISGQPANYWIDRFLIQEIILLLHNKSLTLADIAFRLNFSSQSYFSRYVQKHTGISPSTLR